MNRYRYSARLWAGVAFLFVTFCSFTALADYSATVTPLRDSVRTRAHSSKHPALKLAFKRYARSGAQPVLLIHGLAQNDRCWDNPLAEYSFAQFLFRQGFDVWIGNLRGAGTAGFRSETPSGPHHWTIDDYAIEDIPALIDRVREVTGQAPFIVGHSLAAWALEGYVAGLNYDSDQTVTSSHGIANTRSKKIRGIVTVAGVYNMRWPHSIHNFFENPIRSETDYYHSNYELELLSRVKPLYSWIYRLNEFPLGWIGSILYLRLDQIPIVGKTLALAYSKFQGEIISTPVLNMFYHAPNVNPEMVRLHVRDGLEDLGPRLIEQLANAIRTGRTNSYYHEIASEGTHELPTNIYDYSQVRRNLSEVPMLFIGGTRDRLASADQIYQDGFLATNASDKTFLPAEAGHLDILTGKNALEQVMGPTAEWMKRH